MKYLALLVVATTATLCSCDFHRTSSPYPNGVKWELNYDGHGGHQFERTQVGAVPSYHAENVDRQVSVLPAVYFQEHAGPTVYKHLPAGGSTVYKNQQPTGHTVYKSLPVGTYYKKEGKAWNSAAGYKNQYPILSKSHTEHVVPNYYNRESSYPTYNGQSQYAGRYYQSHNPYLSASWSTHN